ncbi:MAG: 50S ribosomal protein L18 [Alphaproteobacteria bacterium]|jgi:large subunit ribosomal protein L18|nr:50S ribosomal protein L18 [Alphaproteobacteria bacterium]
MATKTSPHQKRMARVRKALAARGNLRPRLSVFRSSKNIYAQIIDDAKGVTLVAASSLEKGFKDGKKTGADKAAAEAIGKLIAERAISAGVKDVVFDRGGYLYHGRVKALADAARAGGLNF